MEDVVIAASAWRGRSVFLTGHTGFKGSWLALWLHLLGARVHGYSLPPPTQPSLFESARVSDSLASDFRGDINDADHLRAAMEKASPEMVLHLAAQPLVRESYANPCSTFLTNVIGTAHVIDSARSCPSVRALVLISTDKVYENLDNGRPFQETDPLGGHDPYSASKAAMEILASSYRSSFFANPEASPALLATARAGNVIGGGDWAMDRLVPDCLRAFSSNAGVTLRYPNAVRPWQHVLEPLYGYLLLVQQLFAGSRQFAAGWNFGPDTSSDRTVQQLAQMVAELWGAGPGAVTTGTVTEPHEAAILRLESSRARRELGWKPQWSLPKTVEETVNWHKAWLRGEDMNRFTTDQILAYSQRISDVTAI